MPAQLTIPVNETIHLTELRPADKAACMELIGDPAIYETTLRIPHPYTAEHFDQFLNSTAEKTRELGHPIHFAIRNKSGQLIGGCGFDGIVHGHRAELGYWLGKPYWGRGFMTDVVRTFTAYAQREWKLIRITAHVFSFNPASARVLEKSGFVLEGELKKLYIKDGRFIDAKLYALVQSD